MIVNKEQLPTIPKANNFDFLRFALATAVCCRHYYRMVGMEDLPLPITAPTAVSGFFAISGFLIFMSFCKTDTFVGYLKKRVRRIFPAYFFVVLASFFLFSCASELSWSHYFTHPESLKYLAFNLSFLNFLQPTLPGVLADAPLTDAVNPSLWTLKIELTLYLLVPLIALVAVRRKILLPTATVLISALCYYLNWKSDVTQIALYEKVGATLYNSNMFFIGACCYLYFDKLYRFRYYILVVSLLIYPLKESGWIDILFPFALAGCVFGIAFSFSFLNKFGKIGDLSYGTYLYHAPIIQFFTAMGWNNEDRLLLILGITYALAFLSWHCMEKKILNRGKNKIDTTRI